jgi:hypothetical protein
MIAPNSGYRIITYKLINKPSAQKSATVTKLESAVALSESHGLSLAVWGWYKLDISFPITKGLSFTSNVSLGM